MKLKSAKEAVGLKYASWDKKAQQSCNINKSTLNSMNIPEFFFQNCTFPAFPIW